MATYVGSTKKYTDALNALSNLRGVKCANQPQFGEKSLVRIFPLRVSFYMVMIIIFIKKSTILYKILYNTFMTTLSNDQIRQLNNYSMYVKPIGTPLFHAKNIDSSLDID